MRHRAIVCLVLFAGLLTLAAQPAFAREICFPDQPDITVCLNDPFSAYWEENGGLPVFGYPLSNARNERNPDLGVELLTQWTERNRLEFHPQNEAPFTILLGRMGAERLAQLGRDPTQEGREAGPLPGCLWFEETGHNVCDQEPGRGFKTYWESNGLRVPGMDAYNRSLQLFGLPLTQPQMETNSSGHTVLTQWFERARFEWHPDNPDEFKVLLGLLGSEMRGLQRGDGDAAGAPVDGTSVFGVEINRGRVAATVNQLREANVAWVRYNGILWNEVEAAQGVRDWSRLSAVDAELQTLAAAGTTPVVIVRGTPGWAQQHATSQCGPITPEALGGFADFMRELVTRYSAEPYNVTYWELGNEPDIAPDLVGPNSIFGCWGNPNDPLYGGGYYAEMLKQVYPAIKQADPTARVVLGGLLLDCDPTNPPEGRDCRSGRFLEGVLQNGGGDYFDIVAYHAYMYWGPVTTDWDRAFPTWSHRGGMLLGKLDFIRSVLAQYGVEKPILMNEGGLLCYPSETACHEMGNFYGDQANYAVRLYSRAWANGLRGAVWYTLNGPGWRDGGLLDTAQQPRPAYHTIKFMASLLDGATYVGPLSNDVLEGYAFAREGTTYHVYWTNDGSVVDLPLPDGTRTVYNLVGQSRAPEGPVLQVGFEPVFIEITP